MRYELNFMEDKEPGQTGKRASKSSDEETYEGVDVTQQRDTRGRATRGNNPVVVVVGQEYESTREGNTDRDDAALAQKKKALREKERLRSLQRRMAQTEQQRLSERERSRRRRLSMTAEQKKAAAEAKMRRRVTMRQAKEAFAAATVLAMNLHSENA